LDTLRVEESDYIAKRLNDQLRTEISTVIGTGKPGISRLLTTLEIDYRDVKSTDLNTVIRTKVLAEANKDPRLAAEVKAVEDVLTASRPVQVASVLDLGVPLKDHPLLAKDFRREKALAFGAAINLRPELAAKLAEKDLVLEEATDATLNELVTESILTKAQTTDLRLVINMSRMGGENLDLIKALRTAQVKALEDLVSWERADWTKVLKDQKVTLPEGEDSLDSYAGNLRDTVEATFPTQYALKRLVRTKFDVEAKAIESVDPLLKQNDGLFSGTAVNTAALKWGAIAAPARKQITKDLDVALTFANTYRHLGVGEILNDKALTPAQKNTAVTQRLSVLDTFYKNNPQLDLQFTDFLDKQAVFNWTGVPEVDRPKIKKQLMAYQRARNLAPSFEGSAKLLGRGLDSAASIASLSEDELRQTTGLDLDAARLVYEKAQLTSIATSNFLEAIRDARHGLFKDIAMGNQAPVVSDLRQLEGFDEHLGTRGFCDCEHCKSIFSPAAYFCDLMYFVEEKVSKQAFVPSRPGHPLYLKNRRPDLWKLKLTCQNTSTEIPYLDVVNDVLEQYVKKDLGIADVYDMLRQSNLSCTLPFHLPLEELRLYLGHFGLSLYDVYRLLGEPLAKQQREKLKLSELDLQIVTTPNPTEVKGRFGNPDLANFKVQDFIKVAALNRGELDDLLRIRFVPEIAQVKVKTITGTTDIQQFEEVLQDLTDARLDLIHRFVRLWRQTRWTIREFDLILSSLKGAGLLNTLEDKDAAGNPKILQLAELVLIQEALDLSAEEVCAMVDEIPKTGVEENQKGLYQRLFNQEKIFGVASVASDGTKTYKAQATLPADKARDTISALLLAGLGITEAELTTLLVLLQVNPDADVIVDSKLISKLFRHARIAKGLGLSIEELIAATKLKLGGAPITQLSHIYDVIGFKTWQTASPFTVAELTMIIRGDESSSLKYQNDPISVAAAVLEIQQADDTDKKALLKAYLQKSFNLSTDQFERDFFPDLLSLDLNSPAIAKALTAPFTGGKPNTPADLDGLVRLTRELERLTLLFGKLQFSPAAIAYLIQNKAVFGVTDLKRLQLGDLVNAVSYRALVEINPAMEEKIRAALIQYQPAKKFSSSDIKTLADLWQRTQKQTQSTADAVTAPTALEAVRAILGIQEACRKLGIEAPSLLKLRATDYPGIQAARDVVSGAFAAKYDDEKVRAEKLEPYGDRINTRKRDALCDYIIARRDKFKFADRSDLYEFFLLDTEMSGCFRTSRLVSAIGSVQLYVHRCLLNLEQSDKVLNPTIADVKVNPTWIPMDEWAWRQNYRVWEANRKVFLYPENYIDPTLRDTKTHIFRELEEELLQEKITQQAAENAYKKYLAQFTELTKLRFGGGYYHSIPRNAALVDLSAAKQGIKEDVYYLVSGVFLAGESEDSGYHLFGRTNVQPYQYYHRGYNHYKRVWGNWSKIQLAIEAAEVSALVHLGKLYLFWTEVQSKEINRVRSGESKPKGTLFKVFLKYSFLDESGKWASPQRIYLGYTHSTEARMYERLNEDFPKNDEDALEKKHDAILDRYIREVFRKPYARLDISQQSAQNGSATVDTISPIELSYLWSQNRNLEQVTYTTKARSKDVSPGALDIVLEVPARSFLVSGNDFDAVAPKPATAEGTLRIAGISMSVQAQGSITLTSASSAIFSAEKLKFGNGDVDFKIAIPLSVNVGHSTPLSIVASNFDLSLSKNELTSHSVEDLTVHPNGRAINNGTVSFLKAEYDVAFTDNGHSAHYVEDGSDDFTAANRILEQFPWGDARLVIANGGGAPETVSVTTVLTDELSDVLYGKGIEQLLALTTQQLTDIYGRRLDFTGAYGEYYREMFFHIPFLIASHLNANQQFRDAKWWYERIFNPTADESPGDTNPSDRNWQYREFRNVNIGKLKEILTQGAAIDAYKKDPFDPHAIAQLRLSAYQKTIVMRYIDNLLDWGDHLFAQDTRESINEAEMLYQLAADILGKRPVKVGKCSVTHENDLTYEKIGPELAKGSEFLVTLEHVYATVQNQVALDVQPANTTKELAATLGNARPAAKSNRFATLSEAARVSRISDMTAKWPPNLTTVPGVATASRSYQAKQYAAVVKGKALAKRRFEAWSDASSFKDKVKLQPVTRQPGLEQVKQGALVFCVPPNVELLSYWDRTEDRLFKIRNCMNISGVRRSLALFQPAIDPMLLVRARAAGLSLEDIVGGRGNPTPYRFSYLSEKCKQFVQTVQSFGGALLSALEKKDVEELSLLRSVHERNILRLSRDIKRQQFKDTQYQYQAAEASVANVQNRVDYYQGLISDGLTDWESVQQVTKHSATILRGAEGVLHLGEAIASLIPNAGSPFAMTYGGVQLGKSFEGFAVWTQTMASILNEISSSAGLEATFQRREQDWKQQLTLAQTELKQSEKQLLAAEIRSLIAEKELANHERIMEQADELHDFYKNKLTNLGLYNYLGSTLSRLYREAYNVAYDMARMAEAAYRFEIDDQGAFIAGDNWQFDRAGLLAGEKLLMQLQKMERAYIEKNVRTPEITQSFSVALLDASQLVQLRQTGSCKIKIPEIAFEVLYPGQYKRLIKSVRLSVPCVVGPYTNVSAKLTLKRGEAELVDKATNPHLVDLEQGKETSITTSSGSNDAGVFEFNFKDERYLPFEGSGAISEWSLELPSAMRSFDYDTIADVILHISYTAKDGDRTHAESTLAAALNTHATTSGLFRLLSLKHEFPNAYNQLLNPQAGAPQKTELTIEKKHFPYLIAQRTLAIAQTKVYIKPKADAAVSPPATMNINGANAVTWSPAEDIALPGSTGEKNKMKGGTVNLSGSPVRKWTIEAGVTGLNKDSVDDVLIVLKYKSS
jgi:hypothetical protein